MSSSCLPALALHLRGFYSVPYDERVCDTSTFGITPSIGNEFISSMHVGLLSGSPGPISVLRSEMLPLNLNLSTCKIIQYFMHMRATSICEVWMRSRIPLSLHAQCCLENTFFLVRGAIRQPAWAITVHKAQGSEYPVVSHSTLVHPLPPEFWHEGH